MSSNAGFCRHSEGFSPKYLILINFSVDITPHPGLPQSGEGALFFVPSPTRGGLGWGVFITQNYSTPAQPFQAGEGVNALHCPSQHSTISFAKQTERE